MRSTIYRARVHHTRHAPRRHAFVYGVYLFALDIDELEDCNRFFPLLGRRRPGVFSVWDDDYLRRQRGSLRERLEAILPEGSPTRVVLLTGPRYFGYVFNPVNFYICSDAADRVTAVVAEVHNTFGEAYEYVLSQPQPLSPAAAGPFEFKKEFYVSPFFDVSGQYRLTLHEFGRRLDIEVALARGAEPALTARLTGCGQPLCRRSLLACIVRYPLSAWLTMTRIHWEAAKLYFGKRLPLVPKPEHPSPPPSFTGPGVIERLRLKGLRRMAGK